VLLLLPGKALIESCLDSTEMKKCTYQESKKKKQKKHDAKEL